MLLAPDRSDDGGAIVKMGITNVNRKCPTGAILALLGIVSYKMAHKSITLTFIDSHYRYSVNLQ